MNEENIENLKDSVEGADAQEELPEPAAEEQDSDKAPNADNKITDEELSNHCRCHIVDDHIQWLCDGEIYLNCLADLLKKEPIIELEVNSSLEE